MTKSSLRLVRPFYSSAYVMYFSFAYRLLFRHFGAQLASIDRTNRNSSIFEKRFYLLQDENLFYRILIHFIYRYVLSLMVIYFMEQIYSNENIIERKSAHHSRKELWFWKVFKRSEICGALISGIDIVHCYTSKFDFAGYNDRKWIRMLNWSLGFSSHAS